MHVFSGCHTHLMLDTVSRCRTDRWPSSPCSSDRCSVAAGCCRGAGRTAPRLRKFWSTHPKDPRSSSCHGWMPGRGRRGDEKERRGKMKGEIRVGGNDSGGEIRE